MSENALDNVIADLIDATLNLRRAVMRKEATARQILDMQDETRQNHKIIRRRRNTGEHSLYLVGNK